MSGFKRLVGEIHRRSLWQVLGIYLAGSWVALQVVEQLAEAAAMPAWIRPLALMLLIVGLPIVLATAFVQEGVGSGTVAPRPSSADGPGRGPDGGIHVSEGARRLFTWRNAVTGGIIAFAALGVTAVGWVIFGPGPGTLVGGSASGPGSAPSVAVLPFENLNADEENRLFTDGIHQDVIAQLQTVGDLTVISRQSVLEYRDRAVDPRTVGEELSVRTIVTASVQRAGDRVRVSASLIDAETQRQLWAEQYNATLTDVFEIQSDIAGQIVAALASNLVLPVRDGAERPTGSFEAYEHYLRGSQLMDLADERLENAAIDVAREELERAIALDGEFAEAHALLALAYHRLSTGAQRDVVTGPALGGLGRVGAEEPARPGVLRELARRETERALRLAPDLAAAHFAMWGVEEEVGRDGLPHLARALDREPGNALYVAEMARALRARGRWDEARDMARRATELNPRSAYAQLLLGEISRFMREFDESETALLGAVRLAANDPEGLPDIMRELLWLEIARGGGAEGVKELFAEEQTRGVLSPDWFRLRFADTPEVLTGGEYDELVLSFRPDATDVVLRCTCYYQKAMMYRASGQTERARVYFDSLTTEVERSRPTFSNRARQATWGTVHARNLARAGRIDEARVELMETIALTADTTLLDRSMLTTIRRYRAMAYAELGDVERAIAELEYLLSVPSPLSPYSLRDRQAWLPLRGNPLFEAFVEEKLAEVERGRD
ncbi:MAG: tetratricopeptide repeat protein [Gemmatimonadota bacterium]|nr:tetratricopeptide repeat protein [Gemmatimonadota bacterium]